jgi:hypothetical protein
VRDERGKATERPYNADVAIEEPGSHTHLRIVVRVVIALIVVWVLATGALVLIARQRVNTGLSALQAARDHLSAQALLTGQALPALESAERDFSSAHSAASNPVLAPWAVVPLVNDNVDSVKALTAAAERVAQVGATAARHGAATLRQPASTGAQRLALLDQISALAAHAQQGLNNIKLGSDFFLVGPLGSARTNFLNRLTKLRNTIGDAQALAQGASDLLRGPHTYLVLAANNGEMRAGSGMFLAAGVATFAGGSFTMGPMVPTPTINPAPGAVPLTGSLATLWGWLAPNADWRNLATSPRFDATAPLAAQMWQAVTGQHVDGVLAVDPVTLQALLAAQGPVQVGSQQLSAANVVSFLLLGQYAGIPADVADQQDRLDQLSGVARATVDALSSRPWQASALISQLSGVGKGRHVLAWSADPVEEQAWTAAGISGELHSDSLAVSVMNFGGNKLDQFLHVTSTLSIQSGPNGVSDAHLVVDLHNEAPTGLPGYVAGPNPASGAAEGVYQGILSVNVPGAASLPTLKGVAPLVAAGIDGPTKSVAGGYFQVARGQTLQATIDFELPAGAQHVEVQPSARIPPITWHYGHEQFSDTSPERLAW